jgi:hypothetical protein
VFKFEVDGARVPENGFVNFGVAASFQTAARIRSVRLTAMPTGRPPPADFFGAAFPWQQQVRRRPDPTDPARTVLDLIVTVTDFEAAESPLRRKQLWAFTVVYDRVRGACDARRIP